MALTSYSDWTVELDSSRRRMLQIGVSLGALGWSRLSVGGPALTIADWRTCLGLPAIEVRTNEGDKAQAGVFFDPYCPFCAELWKRLYSDGSTHRRVSTRWVPVAYMSPKSVETAASLLASGSAQLLARLFSGKETVFAKATPPRHAGGAEPRELLHRNQGVWSRLGGATPTIVFLSKTGNVVVQTGLPPEREFGMMVGAWPQAQLGEFK